MKYADVIIVGAGPAGVTLACDLVRRGVKIRLIDRSPGPFAGSRGKTLQPRTLELMDDLGAIDEVMAHGAYTPPIRIYSPDGTSKFEHLFGDRQATSATPYPRPFTIAQNLTESVLRKRLAELGGAIEYGTELTALVQHADDVVASFATPRGVETTSAAFIVGCDGGGSTLRRLLGVAFEGNTDESRRLYVADLRLSGLDRETWHSFRNADGMLNFAPLATTDLFQCQASIPADAPEQASLEELQSIVSRRSGRQEIQLLDMQWCTAWRLNVRLAAKYRVGRAFLVGDACHVHSPAGAQGLNTGAQDAYNLGWKLASVLKGAPPELLDTYEAERRPIAALMLGMTTALEERSFEKKGFPADREESMLQLAINYRDSPLSAECRIAPGTVVAGDRVPDAAGLVFRGSSVRLFDLLRGPRPAVLAFGVRGQLDALRARFPDSRLTILTVGEDGDVRDLDGQLASGLGITGTALLVIRPDNYLGFAADTIDSPQTLSYLHRILD